jgi:hypothetical protein
MIDKAGSLNRKSALCGETQIGTHSLWWHQRNTRHGTFARQIRVSNLFGHAAMQHTHSIDSRD